MATDARPPDPPAPVEPVPEFTDSDQAWFDQLAGQPSAGSASLEAQTLRSAFEREARADAANPAIAAALAPAEVERRRQQLLFRLRRQHATEPRKHWARRWLPAGLALAASVMLAVVVLPRLIEPAPEYDEPPTMRGEAQRLVRRTVAQPRAEALALAAALREAGLVPQLYQQGRSYFVDVRVPPDAEERALAALRKAGLEAGVGAGRVQFEPH